MCCSRFNRTHGRRRRNAEVLGYPRTMRDARDAGSKGCVLFSDARLAMIRAAVCNAGPQRFAQARDRGRTRAIQYRPRNG